jgi:hypothetical protein
MVCFFGAMVKKQPLLVWSVCCTVALLCMWSTPLQRSVEFLRETGETYRIEGSIHAFSDFQFARNHLFCYSICILISVLYAWFVPQRPFLLILPLLVNALTAIWLIIDDPTPVTTLVPDAAPFLALAVNLVVFLLTALAAFAVYLYQRWLSRSRPIQINVTHQQLGPP